ncbi:MAG: DUF2157 domain-containing protein [Candidatus Thiothrix putei]|uniref:Predicted membrane protein n=2 Tax=Thiothrix TaxID=1030 RepID=A0A1H4GI08_9GAMM|nr:DUF2157 domain-containing protein [Thiothrix caldifontis]WGZ95490.1 MAG: DUF2157 domain-containing protein [Candidatus Thiothrix putei]SEB09147.1 Predicted membrane protein [Thiothrix caldifontis]
MIDSPLQSMSTLHKLNQWLQAGLITPAQHANILSFEAEHRQHSNGWLYSFMILGAVIIGLGIISLIAANWATLPDALKLGADFTLLGGLAAGIVWQYPNRQHGVWFEVLLVSFMVLCLASIGLIAQIYHISGKWYHALLFWAAITFLLSLFARHLFSRFFWVTLFLLGLSWSIVAAMGGHTPSHLQAFPAVLLFAPLLSALLYYLSQHLKPLRGFSGSLFFWFQFSAMLALAFADIARSGGELRDYPVAGYYPAYWAAALLALSIILQRDYQRLNKVLLLASLALLLLAFHPDLLFTGAQRYTLLGTHDSSGVSFWQADDIRAPLLTLLILFLYAIHAGNLGHQHTFNAVTFLIGLRFVIVYFQAMGGLAATGVGLILSGSLIIGMTWAWYKGRDRLRQWVTRGQHA